MSIDSISSSTPSPAATFQTKFQAQKQARERLSQALKAGDLKQAQQAHDALQGA